MYLNFIILNTAWKKFGPLFRTVVLNHKWMSESLGKLSENTPALKTSLKSISVDLEF